MFRPIPLHRLFPASSLLWAAAAWAHPHAWIDVRSTVVVSATGMATAIEEEWLFDDVYTSYVTEATDRKGSEAAAARFAGKVVENLKPYGYFMKIRQDGKPVPISQVTQYRSELRGNQLLFTFTAPLAQPVDPLRHALEFSVYDPTYFIDMAHDEKAPPAIRGPLADRCRLELRKARPSPETIMRAYAMDRGAKPDDALGALFAEKVAMVCK